MHTHERYMRRCFQLAQLGLGYTAPNPIVGAVLVYNNIIIGEGYHQQIGAAHAEVNCINSVTKDNQHLIANSTLYISLEPCAHFGKTPPCTDLIIQHQIKKVIVSVVDPNKLVAGKGIQRLIDAGVEVITNILENEGRQLIVPFYFYHTQHRPYVVLKWAESADSYIGKLNQRTSISNAITQRYVHRLRAQYHAIAIGNTTLNIDKPLLSVRYANGNQPIKLIFCSSGNINTELPTFTNDRTPTIIINTKTEQTKGNIKWIKVVDAYNLSEVLEKLYQEKIQSILVEGGSQLLHSFIQQNLWNEIHQIKATNQLYEGIKAPNIDAIPSAIINSNTDTIYHYYNSTQQ